MLTPIPAIEIGSVIVKSEFPPSIIKLAPDETFVAADAAPNAEADLIVSVPADNVVIPVYVLFPESVKSPAEIVNPPEPLICPEISPVAAVKVNAPLEGRTTDPDPIT